VKVIFIEDVPKVARVGQTRTVADGYARNYLLPRKLAVVAGSQAAVAMESQLQKKIKQRELEEAEMAGLAEKLDGVEITIKAKVGESEKLYGSVTGADIAEELNKSAGHDIDKKKIELAEPIRQLGVHDVTVRFTHEITAVIKVSVISDEPAEEKPEKAEKKEKKTKAKSTKKAKAEKAVAEEAETEVKEAAAEKAQEPEVKEEPAAIVEEAEAIEEELEAKE
jgi:large subunit ribosomal protein L9